MQWKLLTTVIVAFSATQLMAQDQSSRDSSNRHQRSQNDHQNMKKSPEEMKKILDQESVSLTDAIQPRNAPHKVRPSQRKSQHGNVSEATQR